MYLLNNFGDGCNITRNIVSRLVLRIRPYLQIYKSNPKCLCSKYRPIVIPIYKSGPKCLCSNYRPISILSPLSKIFEKCIHDQLYYYFDSHKLFSPDQYGFKKNSSTSDAVLDIYNCLLENLDNKLTTCSVFLDLAKAFDTINHTILLRQLEKYGIRGLPLSLMKNYLTNRKQYTLVSGTKSH